MFFFCSQCAVVDLPCLSPFHDVYVNNVSSVARKGQPDNIHVLYVSLFHCRSNYTQICGSEGGGGGLQIKVVKYRWMFTAVLRRPNSAAGRRTFFFLTLIQYASQPGLNNSMHLNRWCNTSKSTSVSMQNHVCECRETMQIPVWTLYRINVFIYMQNGNIHI